ncbi:MAG: periplasmic heavy metal sensor [Calditrichaeota bacterium]|nr:MAG: periplasmic heavy metal sensor [Calditrichota bacterium]
MNRKSQSYLAFAVIFLLCFAFLVPVNGQPRFGPRGHHPIPLKLLAEKLELSEEQQAQMRELRFAGKKLEIELRSKIELHELQLHKLLEEESADLDAMKKEIQKVAELQGQLRFSKIETQQKIKDVLTPEQLQKLEELQRERHRGGHKRFEMQRFGRPDGAEAPLPDQPGLEPFDEDFLEI